MFLNDKKIMNFLLAALTVLRVFLAGVLKFDLDKLILKKFIFSAPRAIYILGIIF